MFKFIKNTLIVLFALFFLLLAIVYTTGNGHLVKAFKSTYMQGNKTSNINDRRDFDTRVIKATTVQPWTKSENYHQQLPKELQDALVESDSAAFLIIQNGKIVTEHYFGDYDNRSKTNSYSMAKTVLTLLVQIAIEEGAINSWDDSIVKYLPEYSTDSLAQNVTLKNLSAMDSGLEWDESYGSVTSVTTKLYYSNDVEKLILSVPFTKPANTEYYYSSGSTQLLGIILSRALKQRYGDSMSLSNYLSEKLWQPLGMNDAGLWHLDSDEGLELTYCCLNTNARNFAKFGELLRNDGVWNNKKIIASDFVSELITPRLSERYGLSTWLGEYTNKQGGRSSYFSYNGHLGQYIIIAPDYDMVVVRLGEKRLKNQTAKTDVPFYIEQALKVIP